MTGNYKKGEADCQLHSESDAWRLSSKADSRSGVVRGGVRRGLSSTQGRRHTRALFLFS